MPSVIRFFIGLFLPLLVLRPLTTAEPAPCAALNLASYAPKADGMTDDTPALVRCFNDLAAKGGGIVTIPPGDYFLSGAETRVAAP